MPNLGSSFITGLEADVCKSDITSVVAALNALYLALKADGYELTHEIFEDGDASVRNEPCGRLHIVVGSRW
jgi:hypothetical protein